MRFLLQSIALYLICLHIRFKDEIRDNPLNFKHNYGLTCVQVKALSAVKLWTQISRIFWSHRLTGYLCSDHISTHYIFTTMSMTRSARGMT